MENVKIGWKFWTLRIVVIILIFGIGLAVGIIIGRNMRHARLRFAGNGQNHGLQTVSIKNGGGTTTLDRDEGVINKIQNNQITISDNANQQVTVLSEGTTMIVGTKGTGTFSDLKSGQRISVFGTLDSNNDLEARTIFISQN
jgi:hypothetical protein